MKFTSSIRKLPSSIAINNFICIVLFSDKERESNLRKVVTKTLFKCYVYFEPIPYGHITPSETLGNFSQLSDLS